MKTNETESVYSAEELASCSAKLFGQAIKSECVMAAFQSNGITSATKDEAVKIVNYFMKKEVK